MKNTYQSSSPCVGVCMIDASNGYCYGCFRTLREIARWGRFDEDERAAVRTALAERRREAGVPDPSGGR